MPQLDPFIFFDEAFTTFLVFFIFYYFLCVFFMPLFLKNKFYFFILNSWFKCLVVFYTYLTFCGNLKFLGGRSSRPVKLD